MSLHIPGSMCVGVTLWFSWGGVVSVCGLEHYWCVHVECGGWWLLTVWNVFENILTYFKIVHTCVMFYTVLLLTNCRGLHCVSSLTYRLLLLRLSIYMDTIFREITENGVNKSRPVKARNDI